MIWTVRLRQGALVSCLWLLPTLAVACGGASVADPAGSCPPVQPHPDREDGAQGLLDLLNDHAGFVQNELPGWQLRQVTILWSDAPVGFLYAPSPSKGTPATYVTRDDLGQWQVTQDARAPLPQEFPMLELTDLRTGPETVVQTFEAQVPGVVTGGLGIEREDCQLRWHIGGWLEDGDGRPREVVSGVVIDATGTFELTDRYEFPDLR